MEIKKAEFIKSQSHYKDCPPADMPEFAFIGRSNVGKSSLINALVLQNSLAKISQQPGKTQLINHFLVNNSWYLVDLPGYGYARVSMSERVKFEKMIDGYLSNRTNLLTIFVLVDSTLPPQKIDLEFIGYLLQKNKDFVIILTKTDKISSNDLAQNKRKLKLTLENTYNISPLFFSFSAKTKKGREEFLTLLQEKLVDRA